MNECVQETTFAIEKDRSPEAQVDGATGGRGREKL